jgi:hypothetical protein
MLNNNDCVLASHNVECPSCGMMLASHGPRIHKSSKRQIKAQLQSEYIPLTAQNGNAPSERPERTFVLVTCDNYLCEQYTKFKVLELPRIKTPSANVEL